MIYKKEYKGKNKNKRHFDKVPAEKSIDFRPEKANNRSKYGCCGETNFKRKGLIN